MFPNLTHVDFPDSTLLGIGCNGYGSMELCEEYSPNKSRDCSFISTRRERSEFIERYGMMIGATLPHLLTFTVGDVVANVISRNGSVVDIIWPWTNKWEEWEKDVAKGDGLD